MSDDDLADAWRRFAADPVTGGAAFAEAVLPSLEAYLAGAFPRVDDHIRLDAAAVAVLSVIATPCRYDPARGSLGPYLRMAARGDLKNLLDKEKRHQRGRTPWAGVELRDPARNDGDEPPRVADFPELVAAVAALSPEDRAVYDLLIDGERETAVFAAALGLAAVPAAEQFDTVQRAKDRIKARLKRAAAR